MAVSSLASETTFNSTVNNNSDLQIKTAVSSHALLTGEFEGAGVEKNQFQKSGLSKSELFAMDNHIRTRRHAIMTNV